MLSWVLNDVEPLSWLFYIDVLTVVKVCSSFLFMLDSRRIYGILCKYCMSINWVCLPVANTRPRQTVRLTGRDRKTLQYFRLAMRSVDKEMNWPTKRSPKVISWELLEGHHEIEAKDSQGKRRKKTVGSLSGSPIFGHCLCHCFCSLLKWFWFFSTCQMRFARFYLSLYLRSSSSAPLRLQRPTDPARLC